jgi:molybdopterin-guanine dinucleotide biosynthesis protein B
MTSESPPILCIVGWKNAGKTTLTVALAAALNRRGYRVMTVKSGHGFQVDQAGKDSWRHRHEGGVLRTVLSGPRDFAVVGRWPGERMELRELVRRFLWDADIVLAEGAKSSMEPRVEVFRKGEHAGPLFRDAEPDRGPTLALVTDQREAGNSIPTFYLDDPSHVEELADLVVRTFLAKEDQP